jgi:hypothetical protein
VQGLVLDADAVSAYARRSPRVGENIAKVAERDGEVFVPALCLAEAYRTAEGLEHDYLAALAAHRHVTVVPVEEPDCWVVGGWAKKIGSLHLAHAAVETAARPTITLLTAHRDKVTHHLAAEWPIIDL